MFFEIFPSSSKLSIHGPWKNHDDHILGLFLDVGSKENSWNYPGYNFQYIFLKRQWLCWNIRNKKLLGIQPKLIVFSYYNQTDP